MREAVLTYAERDMVEGIARLLDLEIQVVHSNLGEFLYGLDGETRRTACLNWYDHARRLRRLPATESHEGDTWHG